VYQRQLPFREAAGKIGREEARGGVKGIAGGE